MSLGNMMFYGGIAGAVIGFVLVFVLWGSFEKKKRQLWKKLEEEM